MMVNGREYDEERCRLLSEALHVAILVFAEASHSAADHSEAYGLMNFRHAFVDLAYDLNEEIEGFDEALNERREESAVTEKPPA